MSYFNRFIGVKCENLLYHGRGIVLIDKVLECSEQGIKVSAVIAEDNPFLDVYNGIKIFPVYKTVEMMAQSLGCYRKILSEFCGEAPKARIGFLLGARRFDIEYPYINIGDALVIHSVQTIRDNNGFGVYECAVYKKEFSESDCIVAKASLSVLSPDEDFLDSVRADEKGCRNG